MKIIENLSLKLCCLVTELMAILMEKESQLAKTNRELEDLQEFKV
jgi:hypothetical protein